MTNNQHSNPFPVIEGYQLIRCLGHGGMGTVWKAIQLSTRREVAVKFLDSDRLVSGKSIVRFKREVVLAANLNHQNIAHIYDSGVSKGRYYYIMELVEGLHLGHYVSQNKLSVEQIIALIIKICQAIEYAHQQGIIHRDLKPENILISADGEPHILDFGLAKMESIDDTFEISVSQEGQIGGTLRYMSPEQAKGHVKKIDFRTDVYSIGVIIYQLVTGSFPYPSTDSYYEILQAIVEGKIISPDKRNADIPHTLNSIILKALSNHPKHRHASVAALAKDLGEVVGYNSMPEDRSFQTDRKCSSVKSTLWILLVVGSVLAGVHLIYTLYSDRQITPKLPHSKSNGHGEAQGRQPSNQEISLQGQPKQDEAESEIKLKKSLNLSALSDEEWAQQCYNKLKFHLYNDDTIRAKLKIQTLLSEYNQTQFFRQHQDDIFAHVKTIQSELKDRSIIDYNSYVILENPSRRRDSRHAVTNHLDRRFRSRSLHSQLSTVSLRILLEDESLEDSVMINTDLRRIESGRISLNNRIHSGDIITLENNQRLPRHMQKEGYISIQCLHHHCPKIELPMTPENDIHSLWNETECVRDIYIRSIPPAQKGGLVIKVCGEEGINPAGGSVSLANGLLSLTVDANGICRFPSIACGTYSVSAAKTNCYSTRGHKVHIEADKQNMHEISVWGIREIKFKWRLYNCTTNEEFFGKSTIRSGGTWTPEKFWDDLRYPIFRISDWNDTQANIKGTFGNIMHIKSDEPFNLLQFPLTALEDRYNTECPLNKSGVYAWWKHFPDKQFEALIEIIEITPIKQIQAGDIQTSI